VRDRQGCGDFLRIGEKPSRNAKADRLPRGKKKKKKKNLATLAGKIRFKQYR